MIKLANPPLKKMSVHLFIPTKLHEGKVSQKGIKYSSKNVDTGAWLKSNCMELMFSFR